MNEHIVSFSGGKDSTAMLLMMLERGQQVDRILFADVGEDAEFPEMYEYIDRIEKYIGREIEHVRSEKWTFDKLFYGYPSRGNNTDNIRSFSGCPTSNKACIFRRALKTDPLTKAQGRGNTIYIGIAVDEAHRAEAKAYQDGKNQFRFPLIEWELPESSCLQYLKDKGLHNPLYDRFKRLGCWQCPKQSKRSLRALYKHYPTLWEKLIKYQDARTDWPFNPAMSVYDYDELFCKEAAQPTIEDFIKEGEPEKEESING